MITFALRRVIQGFTVVLAVIWFTFTLSYFQPDGALAPAYTLCQTHQTRSCLNHYIAEYGLAKPYIVRLWSYVVGVIVHFNLGHSFKQNDSVSGLLSLYIPRTFWLALVALVLAIAVAVPLGIYQAWKRNSGVDYTATIITYVLYCIPAFVLGFVLQDLLSYHFNILPSSPPNGVNPWAIFTDPLGFVLPVVTLTALSVAGMSKYMRAAVLDVIVQDYIKMAKAKGCSPRRILFRHALRNAFGPIAIIIGLSVPLLLSGALIVEELFNYPGLGYETFFASNNGDIYTVLGITIVVTVATVMCNILADIAVGILNPRVRVEGSMK